MPEDLFDIEEPVDGGPGPAAVAVDAGTSTIVLRVRCEPGPGRPAVAGRQGRALRLRVSAHPGTERAVAMASLALAEVLGVEAGSVEQIEASGSGKLLLLRVAGVEVDEARRALDRAVAFAAARTGPRVRPGLAPSRPGPR